MISPTSRLTFPYSACIVTLLDDHTCIPRNWDVLQDILYGTLLRESIPIYVII